MFSRLTSHLCNFKNYVDLLSPMITYSQSITDNRGVSVTFEVIARTPTSEKRYLDKEDLKNYRPVANIPFLGKVIEKVVVTQTYNYLEAYFFALKLSIDVDCLISASREFQSLRAENLNICFPQFVENFWEMEIMASTSEMFVDFDVLLKATPPFIALKTASNSALNAVVATLASPMLESLRLERENPELI